MFTLISLQRIFFSKLKEVTLSGAIIISIRLRAYQIKIRGKNLDEGRRLPGSALLQAMLIAVTLCCGGLPALAEEPNRTQPQTQSQTQTAVMPEVTVEAVRPGDELVGPYNQPRWAARGRFSSTTDIYVLPPYEFNIDLDYTGTIPKHGQTQNLFTQEFELGLPYRFQIAYENNFVLEKDHSQFTDADHRGPLCPGRLGQASAQSDALCRVSFRRRQGLQQTPMTTAATRMTRATLCRASPIPSSCVCCWAGSSTRTTNGHSASTTNLTWAANSSGKQDSTRRWSTPSTMNT